MHLFSDGYITTYSREDIQIELLQELFRAFELRLCGFLLIRQKRIVVVVQVIWSPKDKSAFSLSTQLCDT